MSGLLRLLYRDSNSATCSGRLSGQGHSISGAISASVSSAPDVMTQCPTIVVPLIISTSTPAHAPRAPAPAQSSNCSPPSAPRSPPRSYAARPRSAIGASRGRGGGPCAGPSGRSNGVHQPCPYAATMERKVNSVSPCVIHSDTITVSQEGGWRSTAGRFSLRIISLVGCFHRA